MSVPTTVPRPTRRAYRALVTDCCGQSIIEAALVLPFLILVVMGVVELGIGLRNQHTVVAIGREGSNLISRGTSLSDAATALRMMSHHPVDLTANAKVIFSVLKRGATVGSANYDRVVLYKRFEFGVHPGTSRLRTRGGGSFGPAPDYVAVNSDTDTSLQVTNSPSGVVAVRGGMIYVTEVFNRRELITPVSRFGVLVPADLYSIAYF